VAMDLQLVKMDKAPLEGMERDKRPSVKPGPPLEAKVQPVGLSRRAKESCALGTD